MRVNAAPEVRATARAGGNQRVTIRIGVHVFTATVDEATVLARDLLAAAEATQVHDG